MRKFILLLVAGCLIASSAFAQRTTVVAKVALTITTNVKDAVIFVDNAQIAGNSTPVSLGNHTVKVTAPGYLDFTTTVAVSAAMTLPVTLQLATANLTIQANPANAAIFIDNAQIKGNATVITLGTHSVKVTAPGYIDFTTAVNVTGNMTLPVTLQAATVALTIQANPGNAVIFIDNGQIKGNVATVTLGTHTVKLSAPGYIDFTTSVNVTAAMTLPVTLQPATVALTIQANPANAAIFIDNGQIKGNTATVTLGTHTVKVSAPGFIDFTTSINVTAATTLPVTLQAATAALTIQTNPSNAAIFVDNGQIKGNTATVILGTHMVKVSAPGYIDFTTSVNVTAAMTLPVTLQPAFASLTVNLPAGNINPDLKGGHWSQIIIWIDGAQQKGNTVQVLPGKHLVRITSGGMQVEMNYDFQAGQNVTFEPTMMLNIK